MQIFTKDGTPREQTLIQNVDFDGEYTYIGKALPGSTTSSAVWQIKRLQTASDGDVTTTMADGDDAYDNIWNNRASLSYGP